MDVKLSNQWLVIFSLITSFLLPAQAYAQTSIMAVGDSITQGVGGQCSYRRPLSQALIENGCNVNFVGSRITGGNGGTANNPAIPVCAPQNTNHQAVSGFRADQITSANNSQYVFTTELNTHQPDIVLVHAGSNDINQNSSVSSTVNDVDKIIDSVFAQLPSATVVVADVIPWTGNSNNSNVTADTAALSAALASLVNTRAANGDAVELVEVKEGFENDLMTYDGIHPNPVGEAFISNKMLTVLYGLGVCNGAQTDVQPPITYISSPAENAEILPESPTLTGTATDEGGTGFQRVRIAIQNSGGLWWNQASGSFATGFDSSIVATMTNTTTTATNWSIPTNLPADDYVLFALALDNNGNQVERAAGNGQPSQNQKVWTTRSFTVSASNVDVAITSPAANSTLSGSSETFAWTANGGAIDAWWLYAGSNPGGTQYFNSGNLAGATSVQVNGLPTDGTTVHARLWYLQTGDSDWRFEDFTYTASTGGGMVPAITSPVAGSTLNAPSATISWGSNGASVTEWWVYAGSSMSGGGQNSYDAGESLPAGTTSTVVTGLPSNGSTVYLTLWYKLAGSGWRSVVTSYTAASGGGPAITSPSQGSTLGSSAQTFTWAANGSAVDEYWLYVGAGVNQTQYFNSGSLTSTSAQVTNLPTNGETVYVRLWHRVAGGTWNSVDSTYTAASVATPVISNPADGTTISTTQTFNWSANGAAVNEWWLYAGTTSGGAQLYNSGSLGGATSHVVSGLPSGSIAHITLWYRATGGAWSSVRYSYPVQ